MEVKMIKQLITAIVGFGLLICGCNSIYFYETEKVALNIEGRPDATRPVSGTFGASMHVAAVVPSKNSDENGPPGEAMSLISYFNFEKDDANTRNPFDDPLTIETVLITGAAHEKLKEKGAAANVFNALSEVAAKKAAKSVPEEKENISDLMTEINEAYKNESDTNKKALFDEQAVELGYEDYEDLREADEKPSAEELQKMKEKLIDQGIVFP
jgi:hypothetical protein